MIVSRLFRNRIAKFFRKNRDEFRDIAFQEPFLPIGSEHPRHNCFVNSKGNQTGLKVQYFKSGTDGVSCKWDNTNRNLEGYPNIVHGGIVASVLDGLMANAVLRSSGLVGVTSEASIAWIRPVAVNDPISGYARVTDRRGQLVEVRATLFNGAGKAVATATAVFFTPTLGHFKKMIANSDAGDGFASAFYQH